MAERVRFLGEVADAQELLVDAHVFAHPAQRGASNAVLEAMAEGVPVVATPTGATVELIEQDRTGLLTAVGCPQSLAAALGRLLDDPSLREKLGQAGLARSAPSAASGALPNGTRRFSAVCLQADPERRKSLDRIVFCCLCALVFIVPWEENFVIAGFESFSRIFGALAFSAGVAFIGATLSAKPLHRALIVLFVFANWSFASMIWSIDRAATLDRSISFMLLVVFSWLIYQFTDTPSRQQWLMRAYVFGTAIVLAAMFLGVVHFAASAEGGAHRFAAQARIPTAWPSRSSRP